MRNPFLSSLFCNIRPIQCLSTVLLIYFCTTLLSNSLSVYLQYNANTDTELCDFPFCESEPICDSEAHNELKEKFEVFTPLQKSEFLFILEEDEEFFFVKECILNEKISDLQTPPPQLFV